jgi:hypothetical protein
MQGRDRAPSSNPAIRSQAKTKRRENQRRTKSERHAETGDHHSDPPQTRTVSPAGQDTKRPERHPPPPGLCSPPLPCPYRTHARPNPSRRRVPSTRTGGRASVPILADALGLRRSARRGWGPLLRGRFQLARTQPSCPARRLVDASPSPTDPCPCATRISSRSTRLCSGRWSRADPCSRQSMIGGGFSCSPVRACTRKEKLGYVWIQGQIVKGQMVKLLLLSHQMFGRLEVLNIV